MKHIYCCYCCLIFLSLSTNYLLGCKKKSSDRKFVKIVKNTQNQIMWGKSVLKPKTQAVQPFPNREEWGKSGIIKGEKLLEIVTKSGMPKWGIGIDEPRVLFEYNHYQNAPPQCQNPNLLLTHIKDKVNQDNSKEQNCNSRSTEHNVIEIRCALTDKSNCTGQYSARIWSERISNSSTNYVIYSHSWLNLHCKKNGEIVVFKLVAQSNDEHFERIQVLKRESSEIFKEFNNCKPTQSD